MFTMENIKSCWPYALDYFLEILNGTYSLEDAREDLNSLILEETNEKEGAK